MKNRSALRIACIAALLVGGLMMAAGFILPLLLTQTAPSMGIIGGADGPTVIVVATRTGIAWDVVIAAVLLIAGTVGLIMTRRPR